MSAQAQSKELIVLDREFCPVCEKKCHHDASLSPKQVIDPGFGGISSAKKYEEKKVEEEIIA